MDLNLSQIVNYDDWNIFNSISPDGSVYFDTRFLSSLGVPFTIYGVYDANNKLLAGACIIEDIKGERAYALPFPYVPYQSILFSVDLLGLKEHKKYTIRFRLTEFLITNLSIIYKNLSFNIKSNDFDLRPFLWHNYNNSTLEKFTITPRYTAILDLIGFNRDLYLKNIRTVRRQEIKKSKAVFSISDDFDLFLFLYKKTFERQNISLNENDLLLVKRICEVAINNSFGILTQARLPEGVASVALFLFDNQTAYYQFGANDPDFRSSGASSFLMFESISKMANNGLKYIDFVGVNSPKRGDFKLSFNPTLKPYYSVQLGQ